MDPKSEVSNVVNSDRVGAVFQPASVVNMPVTVNNHPEPEMKVDRGLVVVNRLLSGAFVLVLILLAIVVSRVPVGEPGAQAVLSPTSTTSSSTSTAASATTTTESPTAPALAVRPEVVPPVPSATQPVATSVPAAPPSPRVEIAVGAPTGSSRCESPSCHWIDTRLSGFPPNARIEVVAIGNGRNFSEDDPCVTTTDANGVAVCGDTRYDVPGAEVYAYVDLGGSRITSNTITWPKG